MTTQRYSFGRNWKRFLRSYDENRLQQAQQGLLRSLHLGSMAGLSFLDIGCGSGIHSLAALRSGADRVLSVDYDHDSVAATRWLWEREGHPDNWQLARADILDEAWVGRLDAFDIVYSWGVLHHTGEVWRAFRNAARALASNGVLLVALYTSDAYADTEFALQQKRRYAAAGRLGRGRMVTGYVWWSLVKPNLRRPWSIVSTIARYKKNRGMAYLTDVRDWLGGWPMEFCGVAETREFARSQLGLESLACYGGKINTEYLFAPAGARNWWTETAAQIDLHEITGPYRHLGGQAWSAPRPAGLGFVTDNAEAQRRRLELREDGAVIGPSNAWTEQIQRFGAGAFSVESETVVLSSSDGSAVPDNGRCYQLGHWPADGA